MKKKLLAAGLSLTLLVAMTACGNSGYKIDSQLQWQMRFKAMLMR